MFKGKGLNEVWQRLGKSHCNSSNENRFAERKTLRVIFRTEFNGQRQDLRIHQQPVGIHLTSHQRVWCTDVFVCVCALLLAENLTSCMNFLQTTRKSLGNVALNIITCFSCGVIFTISWTSRRISKTDFVYNEVKLWSYNTYMILLRYKRKTKTKIYHYHQSFYRIHPKQNIWHFSISSFLVAPAGEYGREFQQQCVVC